MKIVNIDRAGRYGNRAEDFRQKSLWSRDERRALHGRTQQGQGVILRDTSEGASGRGIEEPQTRKEGQTVVIGGHSRGLYHVTILVPSRLCMLIEVHDVLRCVTRRGSNPHASTGLCMEDFSCF
jgi:hypothetical protein